MITRKSIFAQMALWQSRIILWLVYWLVVPIFALVRRLLIPQKEAKGWRKWKMQTDTLEEVGRQY